MLGAFETAFCADATGSRALGAGRYSAAAASATANHPMRKMRNAQSPRFIAVSLLLVRVLIGRAAEQAVATIGRDKIVHRQEFDYDPEDGARVGVGHEVSVGGVSDAFVTAREERGERGPRRRIQKSYDAVRAARNPSIPRVSDRMNDGGDLRGLDVIAVADAVALLSQSPRI